VKRAKRFGREVLVVSGDVVEPNYFDAKRLGGDGSYDDSKQSFREKCEDSVVHILQLISRIGFSPSRNVEMIPMVADAIRTEDYSPEDRAGTDIEVVFSREFADFTGFEKVGVQSKSSEVGVDVFTTKGQKKFGDNGSAWIEAGRILLDGQWADNAVIADFLVQLMNLMGIWGKEDEVTDFLSCLDQDTVTAYNHAYLQIDQYRSGLLSWVAGKSENH
jgi:hypothetical protein